MDKFKIVAMDLDGTLLRSDKSITNKFDLFLKECNKKAIIPLIATGREYHSAKSVLGGREIYIICNNGNLIRNIHSDELIYKNPFPKSEMVDILEIKENYELDCLLHVDGYFDDVDIIFLEDGSFEFNNYIKKFKKRNRVLTSFKELNYDILSIVFSGSDEQLLQFKNTLDKIYGSKINTHLMRFSPQTESILEVLQKDGDKYNAVFNFATERGFEMKNVISVGDDVNDLNLITKSGLGIAMKNAVEELKSKADLITRYDNDNDGCIEELIRVLGFEI